MSNLGPLTGILHPLPRYYRQCVARTVQFEGERPVMLAPHPGRRELGRWGLGLRELGRRGRTASWLLVLALLAGFGSAGVLPHGNAVSKGERATTDHAQVRIFENGQFRGGGTVVAPNWVFTAAHLFHRVDSDAYSLSFGVVDGDDDPSDQSNLRSIDRIVLHSTLADVALVHFRRPVPSTIRIPQLAKIAPEPYSAAHLYGWAPTMRILTRGIGLIIDPVASENAAALRDETPEFAAAFPDGVDPMVTNAPTQPGDSGSGVFSDDDRLLAVHSGKATYRHVGVFGHLAGTGFLTAFEVPVWHFRDWISQVTSGESPSDPDPPHDELKRRRLAGSPTGGKPPMTLPPQTLSSAAPSWPVATLTPEPDSEGLVTVACPTVSGVTNVCTQEIEGQLNETVGNDDPVKIRIGSSGRPVVAWCRTTDTLTTGAEPVPVVRLSFTNADTAVASNPPPTGYGWYDVNPARVLISSSAIDPTILTTC